MNSYLEILFWTITVYIIAVAIVHFIKVVREKKENNINLTKAVIYLAGGLTLAMLLLYKPFGASIVKIVDKLGKRPISAATETVMITTTTMGPTSVSV
jgi:nucleoside permease NupC